MHHLMESYPQAIPILIHHHMDCVGCQMALFDSLEFAAETYHHVTSDLIREISQVPKLSDR